MPSKAAVCRAIISSSSVGITQADMRLPAFEMRRSCRVLAAWSSSRPSHAHRLHDTAADLDGVLADAGGENQRIDAAEHGGQRADVLGRFVDEVVHRQASRRLVDSEQNAHVVADAGDAEEARLLVKHLLHVGGRHAQGLEEMQDHAGIHRARTRPHAESVERGEAERGIDALSRVQRAQARAAAEMRDDHTAVGDLRRDLGKRRRDVLVGEPVEAVALHARVADFLGSGTSSATPAGRGESSCRSMRPGGRREDARPPLRSRPGCGAGAAAPAESARAASREPQASRRRGRRSSAPPCTTLCPTPSTRAPP